MPSIPRIEVAIPTVDAGIPRPPVKENGREFVCASEAWKRGVDRKSIQMLANALEMVSM